LVQRTMRAGATLLPTDDIRNFDSIPSLSH
jgi:hypothetical protein